MEKLTQTYHERNLQRQQELETATTNLIKFFVDSGDDLLTAKQKVSDVSSGSAQWLFPYVLGNKQPLIQSINDSTLPFMDSTAKTFLINELS
jgi:hypothetical protein